MTKTKSFFRREEYNALSLLSIDGEILDVGGSKKSGYHELIGGAHTITVGNIDEVYGIDVVFDAQHAWPFDNKRFSAVLFINLLEHLYDYRTALREAERVLAPQGKLIGVVPFMFNVHASPNDFYRYTASALTRMLEDAGFVNITVQPLGTGAFSVIYHCLMGFIQWNWLASMLIPVFRSLDRFMLFLKPRNKMSAEYMPLGYFFQACKN